jgi:hypothetical protein
MDDVVADKSNRSHGTRLKRNVIMVTKRRGCCGREGDALQHKRYCLQSSSHIWREIRHTPPLHNPVQPQRKRHWYRLFGIKANHERHHCFVTIIRVFDWSTTFLKASSFECFAMHHLASFVNQLMSLCQP